MARWQQGVRLMLVAFLAVLIGGIYLGVRHGRRPVPVPAPRVERADPASRAEYAGGELKDLGSGRGALSVKYARQIVYEDGRQRLLTIDATVPTRSGRTIRVRSDEADVARDRSNMVLRGHVQFESSDGIVADTDQATYSEGEGVIRAPGRVRLARGRLSGTGLGMTYDQKRDVLWLLDKAEVTIGPDESGRGATNIRSRAAGLARADHYARFEDEVRVQRDGQTISADNAVAYLTEDQEHVERVELRGHSQITADRVTAGGLESMRARDINLEYGDQGQALQRAVLAGEATIQIAGTRGSRGKRLASEWLALGLAPDGTTLTDLSGRDHVALDLPASETTPARVITSGTISGSGTAETGITATTFGEGVQFREAAGTGSERRGLSRTLVLQMKPGFGDLEAARFIGAVQLEQGSIKGRARDGRYDIGTGTFVLTGADEQSGAPPEVEDERATIKADGRIEVALDTDVIVAGGGVSTLMRQADRAKPQGSGPAPVAGTRPGGKGAGLFSGDAPVQGKADGLNYDGHAHRALYTGHVRLWQNTTKVEGERVQIDDERGDVTATGSAATEMLVEQVNEETKVREQVLTRGHAAEFNYQDATRLARYTTDARLKLPQGDLDAVRIELILGQDTSEVERLEAYEDVRLKTPDGRVVTGTRVSYLAAENRYTVSGRPAKLVDECRGDTTGSTLIFYRSADRIIADGSEERRTQTKGRTTSCPGNVK